MSCLVLGYSAPSWGAQRLCKVLEGGTADDQGPDFPWKNPLTLSHCTELLRSRLPEVRTTA